jgi:hypothetical protein
MRGASDAQRGDAMRRRMSLSFVLAFGFAVTLGMAPAMLARQGEPDWSDIEVTCGGERCVEVDGYQTYGVALADSAFFPEVTYDTTIVVRIVEGALAFRVAPRATDVMVEPAGNGIPILQTNVRVPFGQLTAPSPTPTFTNTGRSLSASQCSVPPHRNLCRLDPNQFRNMVTFVQLGTDDIVYIPASSMCFVCNVTGIAGTPGTVDNAARVEIWAPGNEGTWYEVSQNQALGPTQTRLEEQELHDISAWMLNPGSPCH